MPNKSVVVTADSPCDLSKEIIEKYNVTYFPYYIRLRDKEYKDNINIFPTDLYKEFHKDGTLPSTAASSPVEYTEFFKQFTDNGKEVVHISLSHSLTSGCQNAQIAAQQMDGVFVIDSNNLSSGAGLLALNSCRLAQEGKSASEIAKIVEGLKDKVRTTFVMNTLDYMVAGGRCPSIAGKAAGMLKCKPALEVKTEDGTLHMMKMYRGKHEKVLKKYVDDLFLQCEDVDTNDLFIVDSGELDDGILEALETHVKTHYQFKNIHYSTASCTISSHCGPSAYGVLFLTK